MFSLKICIALFLDLLFGDPSWYPHPVRCIGLLITWFERIYSTLLQNRYVAGALTVISVLFCVTSILAALFTLASQIAVWLVDIVAIFILYTAIAVKDLRKESMSVHGALVGEEDIAVVRGRVARIVGRDTAPLSRTELIRATVETVAENMADGIISPLFWAIVASAAGEGAGYNPMIFAAGGAMLYKAVNTMDSMIGYKNEQYLQFGRIAARLDDIANLIPARLTGVMIVLAAFILRLDGRESLRILRRDSRCHASPNAGFPEAAMAGALGVRLCGPTSYFGVMVEKPFIGNDFRPIEADDIVQANRLVLLTTCLLLIAMLLLRWALLLA